MLKSHWLGAGLWLASLAALTGTVSADSAEQGKHRRTFIGADPWVFQPAPAEPKVIYGADDRIDLYEETDPDRRAWAASTCGLVSTSDLQNNGNGTWTLRTSAYDVCPEEPFSNQPTVSFCSGFMVGDDLIATAGHCYDTGDLSGVRFVFGFVMEDANTPVLTVDNDQVYQGIEVVGRALGGDLDYAVIRVDRPITSPGAEPFDIRREGTLPVGSAVGVIGHPSGLPLKIAFGASTAVRENNVPGYFVANLDTYGGNSGSPVINPLTGVIEGILVRGETDFVSTGACLVSNVVSDNGGRGEDVSKTTSFMEYIPELLSSNGAISLDRSRYGCDGDIVITLSDADLTGAANATVTVATDGGDSETLVLTPGDETATFTGSISIGGGAVTPGNNAIEAGEGAIVTVSYDDAAHDPESPDTVTESAEIDCSEPVISNVSVTLIGARYATVQFETSESAIGRVFWGEDCAVLDQTASAASGTTHSIQLQNLSPLTSYRFRVEAEDDAGNTAADDNGGECFQFATLETTPYYTQVFAGVSPDLTNRSVSFTPDETGYTICQSEIDALPVAATGSTSVVLSDDGFSQVQLTGGAEFPYFGQTYDRLFINANGNITFTSGDSNFDPSVGDHFSSPRVSALFTDLDPSNGGSVWHRQLEDRIAVTWQSVAHFSLGGTNTMQVELFFDGTVRISYRTVSGRPSIVGLSGGQGPVPDFANTDLSAQVDCGDGPGRYHSADTDENFVISVEETLRVVQFYNIGAHHCDETGQDGYAPGNGVQTCVPHDSDYNPEDWSVSMSEVLRLVQLYNAGGYSYTPGAGTEDGFLPAGAKRSAPIR